MKSGDLYQFIDQEVRILCFDEHDVFYEPKDTAGQWYFANKKTITYFKVPFDFFINKARLIALGDLSEKERKHHRPELPLRLNCFEQLWWDMNQVDNEVAFSSYLAEKNISKADLGGINIGELIIIPSSQQTSPKKTVRIGNEEGFMGGKELLWACCQIQRPYLKPEKPYFSSFRLIKDGREEKRLTGVGIYRSGLKGGVPSYYLGGYQSWGELSSRKE